MGQELQTFTTFFQIIHDAGSFGLWIFFFYGGFKEWWVYGHEKQSLVAQLADLKKDRDEWRDRALANMRIIDRAVELSAKAVA